jgi:NTE family protein
MIIASRSLPLRFAPMKIANEWYLDGSLVTAAPMQHLVETAPAGLLTTILRADLWSTEGRVPDKLTDAESRQKNSQHGSRAAVHHETLNELQLIKLLFAYALDCIGPSRRQSKPRLMDAAVHVGARPIQIVAFNYLCSQRMSHCTNGPFTPAAIETDLTHGREAAKAALARMTERD